MNKMVKLGLVAGGAVTLYFVFHKGSNIAVSNKQLRDLAEAEVPDIYSDRCIDAMAKYEDAKVAADGVRKADKVIRDQAKIEIGYSTAVSNSATSCLETGGETNFGYFVYFKSSAVIPQYFGGKNASVGSEFRNNVNIGFHMLTSVLPRITALGRRRQWPPKKPMG